MNLLKKISGAAESAKLWGLVQGAKLQFVGKPLPQEYEAQFQRSLPEGLRLVGTRVASIDHDGGIVTGKVELKLETDDVDSVEARKAEIVGKPLPGVDDQIQQGLPKALGLRLLGTRVVSLDREGNTFTAHVEVKLENAV